ncbi:deaminase domain-containing protein [Nostoc sp. ChiSLP03a]|uniref:deaminase domain-containing protein n=1 Tax=Nostoc sp. ChiSLP03a TaxID=3075380 RepID=UPI002AD28E40|nr:deaminase domain-containing protein [Nostoc sp. ChiSLP03a]MDZ8211371.1 deaminase domain-containing protein [Nostoc sp. ChiSLP03a]
MDWLKRVAEIRKTCNVPAPARNVAIARVWLDETFTELFAFSGKLLREGAVVLPTQPMLKTFEVTGHRRDLDSEYKILEAIAQKYTNNREVKSKIELFTEREPCDSCEYVIKQFRQTFPNIQLNIYHGNIA